MTNCVQKADGTAFRFTPNITKSGQTYCFNLTTGVPANAQSPCAKAKLLEHIHMWANWTRRGDITATRVYDKDGSRAVTGFWSKGSKDNTQWIVKLNWTVDYVATARPRVCLTLAAGASLKDLCLGPNPNPNPGSCIVALHSIDVKCCPVYAMPVPGLLPAAAAASPSPSPSSSPSPSPKQSRRRLNA